MEYRLPAFILLLGGIYVPVIAIDVAVARSVRLSACPLHSYAKAAEPSEISFDRDTCVAPPK